VWYHFVPTPLHYRRLPGSIRSQSGKGDLVVVQETGVSCPIQICIGKVPSHVPDPFTHHLRGAVGFLAFLSKNTESFDQTLGG
jgi:hypothetical protein